METKLIKIKNSIILFLIATLCIIALIIGTADKNKAVYAENANVERIIPVSDMEYTALSNPKDICYTEDYCAIIQGDKLSVFKNNKLFAEKTFTDTLKQVKAFTKDKLIISKSTGLFFIDVSSASLTETRVQYYLSNGDTEPIDLGGNYFDILSQNDSTTTYIISAFSDKAFLLKITEKERIQLITVFDNIDADYPVIFNPNGMIFFCSSTSLYQSTIESYNTISKILDVKPSKMVASGEYLYYVYNSCEIYKLDIAFTSSYVSEKMICTDAQDKFELGKIIAPTSISLNGNNLLITDASINAAEEFIIDNDKLTFSGFAIASGKTAFNRISTRANNVVKSRNLIAVTDRDKLTVIKREENFNAYDRNNFLSFFAEDLGGILPKSVAINESSVMFTDNTSKIWYLEFNDGESLKCLNLPDNVSSVYYSSGIYYACTYNGTHAKIYTIDLTTLTASEIAQTIIGEIGAFTVDVNKNVYLYNKTESRIVSLLASENYASQNGICDANNIKNIYTDLGGMLFMLSEDGTFTYLDGTTKVLSFHSAPIKLLTLSFESKEVIFITDGAQSNGDCFVYSTSSLPNIAIDDIDIPSTFNTAGKSADISEFKVYSVKDGANMYSVNKGENGKFIYNGLKSDYQEYVYICSVDITRLNRSTSLLALASKDGIILINKADGNDITPTIKNTVPKAFITTSVNCYYLPLITKNGEYALFDGQTVRLQKGTAIFPKKTFAFDNKTYYFASVNVNGVEYSGYIPTAFTVEVLSKDYPITTFSLEQVTSTKVYADESLKSAITTLDEETYVRLIETKDNVAKIAFTYNGEWTMGYISSSAITKPKFTLKSTVIVIVALVVVTGSVIYLVAKKKNN